MGSKYRGPLAAFLVVLAVGLVFSIPVGNWGGAGASAAYYYYNPGAGPLVLQLAPTAATNRVGTTHTLTATVTQDGNPIEGVSVDFTITGATSLGGSCTTDNTGVCTFSYTGPTHPGADAISAFADANGNGSLDAEEPVAAATKAWVAGPPASLTVTPTAATNYVGTSHTLTATVTDLFGNPLNSITVRFSVTGSVTTSGSCVTAGAGSCTFTYNGPALPGADAITAFADTNGSGTLDAGEPTAAATKAWILPTSTPGQVTGGGQISFGGGTVTFGFNAKNTTTVPKGECTVVRHDTKKMIKCIDATTLVQSGNEAWIYGHATDDGVATTYVIHVVDNGDPGKTDTFSITTASGYAASGTLTGGNIQVH